MDCTAFDEELCEGPNIATTPKESWSQARGEDKTRARGMSEWHALKPEKAGTQDAHCTLKTGPVQISKKIFNLKISL